MSEQQKSKKYAPVSAKLINFANGGHILKLNLNAEKFSSWAKEHANEKGWLTLGISERRSPSDYGDTHAVWLDEWKPPQKAEATGGDDESFD